MIDPAILERIAAALAGIHGCNPEDSHLLAWIKNLHYMADDAEARLSKYKRKTEGES